MKTGKYGRQILTFILSLGMAVTPILTLGDWTAYARTGQKASGSNLFRTKKSSDSNVSRDESDESSMVPAALAAAAESEDVGLNVYHNDDEFTDEEFTFTYTTVNHQKREKTVEKDSSHGIDVLTQTFQFERDGDIYKGFKVLGCRIELPVGGDEDDEEEIDMTQDMQVYYADSFGEGEFYSNMLMELTMDEVLPESFFIRRRRNRKLQIGSLMRMQSFPDRDTTLSFGSRMAVLPRR